MNVEIHLNSVVVHLDVDHVLVSKNAQKDTIRIPTQTVIWAAGVRASGLSRKLADSFQPPLDIDRSDRIQVTANCTLPDHPEIFVIGDMARFLGNREKPLPGLAPVAMQQGRYVAKIIDKRMHGREDKEPFVYHDKGTMATIGRSRAVADLGWTELSGMVAWLAWLFIHIMYIVTFQNRILVMIQWSYNFFTRNRSARLITHSTEKSQSKSHNTNDITVK